MCRLAGCFLRIVAMSTDDSPPVPRVRFSVAEGMVPVFLSLIALEPLLLVSLKVLQLLQLLLCRRHSPLFLILFYSGCRSLCLFLLSTRALRDVMVWLGSIDENAASTS